MDFRTSFDQNSDQIEDFWGRRRNRARHERNVTLFDRTIRITSNHLGMMSAIDYCLPLYSTFQDIGEGVHSIQFAVQQEGTDAGPVAEELFDQISYAGDSNWLAMQLGDWGHCNVDLALGQAVVVLAPQLADRPDLVARCVLNTILTNFFIANGYAMLHASCVVRGGRALMLIAPHNSGKSTTALRLVLAGRRLLTDSMVFMPSHEERTLLSGFPVGRIKLRGDMLPAFPELQPALEVERVRGEIKYSVDLRKLDPALVYEEALRPTGVDLCIVARSGSESTSLETTSRRAIEDAAVLNSLYFDTETVWRRNWECIEGLLDGARYYRLSVGSDAPGMLAAMESLG